MTGADLRQQRCYLGAQVRLVRVHGIFKGVQNAVLGFFQLGDIGSAFIAGQFGAGVGIDFTQLAGQGATGGRGVGVGSDLALQGGRLPPPMAL